MPTFVASGFKFGAYTFPASFSLATREGDVVIEKIKAPQLDGNFSTNGYRSSQAVQLVGTIGGAGSVDSSGAWITTRAQARAELNLMSSYLYSGEQRLSIDATDLRYALAQVLKVKIVNPPASGGSVHEVTIDFEVQDPRWLSATPSGLNARALGAASTFTSNGTTISFPLFTIRGPIVNPSVTVTPAGAPGAIVVAPVVTLVGGDVLIVDADPRNRARALLLNGAPRFDLLGTAGLTNNAGDRSFFPYLRPGANTGTVSGSSGTGTWDIAWSDAYLF